MKILKTIVSIPFFILLFKILDNYQTIMIAGAIFAAVTLVYYIYVEKYRLAEGIIITAVCLALGLYLPISIGKLALPF